MDTHPHVHTHTCTHSSVHPKYIHVKAQMSVRAKAISKERKLKIHSSLCPICFLFLDKKWKTLTLKILHNLRSFLLEFPKEKAWLFKELWQLKYHCVQKRNLCTVILPFVYESPWGWWITMMRILFEEVQLNFKVQQWSSFQWAENLGLRNDQDCVFEDTYISVELDILL